MEKKDQQKNQAREPQFNDSDYSQEMRVDPLTTRDAITREVNDIHEQARQRQVERDAQNVADKEATAGIESNKEGALADDSE